MKRIFLEKYFPASRAANIRKEIYGIKQYSGESLHEYWERNMLDAVSGGVFVDKTPVQARNLIENMAANSQQFGTNRSDPAPRRNNELEELNSNNLPSQTVVNPKENMSAITLRSGKELKVNKEVVKEPVEDEDDKESKVEENKKIQEAPRDKFPPLSEYKIFAPFPLALKESRKEEEIKGLYEVFRRCECQKVELGEQVSAVIQRKILTKCKDPSMFSIHCKIGDVQLDMTMLDLGASINVMTYSIYVSLNLGPLTETTIVIQMADRSTFYPRGLLEYVLVQVDVNNGTLTMEFDRNRMPPPPQSKFQYDSSVMLSDDEEDSANT
ncbi:uncharacterized protein [Henckelia pumila]|uniref:uncharacterized protein n=1 Tax=Henckelia pumila TaxID=405737 RepID=UPI003C6E3D37